MLFRPSEERIGENDMKAYAIKNKEGKYWQFLHNEESEFVDEIYNAFFHYSKQDAKKSIDVWNLSDCQVVEITIEETKAEEQNVKN